MSGAIVLGKNEGQYRAKNRVSILLLAEIAVSVALAGALNLIKIFYLPQGGSITLASMTPVILLALRRGARAGIFAGIIFGLIVLVEEPFVVHPIQFLLDYPVAFGALGLAGFFQREHWVKLVESHSSFRNILPIIGVAIGITARFVSHFVSGIVYFASYAPAGEDVAIYSAAYNGSYLLPEMLITAATIIVLVRFKILDMYR